MENVLKPTSRKKICTYDTMSAKISQTFFQLILILLHNFLLPCLPADFADLCFFAATRFSFMYPIKTIDDCPLQLFDLFRRIW